MKERHFTINVSISDDPQSPKRYAAKHAIIEDLPEQGDQELIDNSAHYNESADDIGDLLTSVLDSAADRIAEHCDEGEEDEDEENESGELQYKPYPGPGHDDRTIWARKHPYKIVISPTTTGRSKWYLYKYGSPNIQGIENTIELAKEAAEKALKRDEGPTL